ncbi:amine dehydrogenase large subunit [Novosphingobium umbonatum]|nr:amine dehydrogenase large subunit [Novosphingobium umbonatum]
MSRPTLLRPMAQILRLAPLALAVASGTARAAPENLTEPETATSATLPAPSKDWFFVRGYFETGGTSIVDSATSKMLGMVNTSGWSDLAFDPMGKVYYVAETLWSKGNRGTRQDMVSVYDAKTLLLQTEIPIPGRLIIGAQLNNFAVSADGKTGYVYNLTPAASVNVVDLVKRKFVKNVELPGCAGMMPIAEGLVSVCSDGSLATVNLTGAKAEITRSAPFFVPTVDPVFDSFSYSAVKKQAVFISYTGLIYTAKIGAKPEVAAPFSIQAAAGLRAGDTKPLDVNWLPGGWQVSAWHRASNHLYVLMHMGEYWSQKELGSEIWDVDLTAKKVVRRFPLEDKAGNLEVTQGDKPKLFVNSGRDGVVIDLATWKAGPKIKRISGGIISTIEAP